MAVLEKLKSEFNLSPSSIMADYEASLRFAIKQVYPEVDLRGCWFHFAQVSHYTQYIVLNQRTTISLTL